MNPLKELWGKAAQAWSDWAERYRLRDLPVVPAVCVALAVGLVVPLIAEIDRTPAEVSLSLAESRLERYAERGVEAEPAFGPVGPIFSTRPAFYWPPEPGAERYELRVFHADGRPWTKGAESVDNCYYLLPGPSRMETGRSYRFEVRSIGADGGELRLRRAVFSVVDPPEDLADLRRRVARHWGAFECARVLLGYYAELNAHHDVLTALLAAYEADRARFEREMLDGTQDWVARRVGQVARLVRH